MQSHYEELWFQVLGELENYYDEDVINDVFKKCETVVGCVNNHIQILAPDELTKNRINRFYLRKINDFLKKYTDETLDFKFILKSEIKEEKTLVTPDKDLDSRYRQGNLNAQYSFDNYVVGNSNKFAFRMAMKIAEQPGEVANPLYIFGDVGLGKTHLMQAIGNYIYDGDITKKILYIKADEFIEDYANYSKNGQMELFNEKYRSVDVLLMDDIQILELGKKSQIEFFKLFDILYNANKQIVITSDRPASELNNIMPRLTSRLSWGLSVDIQSPDKDHRIKILTKKMVESSDESMSDDVLNYIASYFTSNVRELEGALKRVLYYCLTNGIEINVDNATEALTALMRNKQISNSLYFEHENEYDRIQSIVSDFYHISVSDLIGSKRSSKYVLPRHIAMYLMKTRCNLPYKKIGALFNNRDHSTVISAYEKISSEIKTNDNLKLAIETIDKKITKNY